MGVGLGTLLGLTGISKGMDLIGQFGDWQVQRNLNNQQQELTLDRMKNEQFFNARQAAVQRSWEKEMSNSQYQRAIADMEAAGLNPASLVGSSPSGAGVPNAAAASAGIGSTGSSSVRGSNSLGSLYSSAIQGMIAKDRDAAKFLADELRDNAKHAHKMEEIAEAISEHKSLEAYKKEIGHKSYFDYNDRYNEGFKELIKNQL